jgi:hypothetical protein
VLAGTYMQKKTDEQNFAMQQAYAAKLREAATGQSGSQPVGFNASGMPSNSGSVQGGTPQNTQDKYQLSNLVRGQAIEALGGDAAGRTFWADKAATETQKNNEWMGISRDTARENALAEARVKGTQTLANGQTAILPNGDRITGIDQDKGINTEWVNGQPISRPIQGTTDILSANAAAVKAGENRGTLAPIDALPRNPDGTYNPATVDQVINPSQGGFGRYGTPNAILDSLKMVESSGNPNAVNKESGAGGAYQFMEDTVKMLANKGIKFDRFNEKEARDAADYYLQDLLKQSGGDYKKALAKYGGFITKDPSEYVDKVIKGAGEPFGLKKSTEGNVELANTRYATLSTKNTNAPVMIDALNNVIKYAPGAITGGAAEKRELINAIGALIPGFDQAKTAEEKTNLLKKNMSRIVGAGSNVPGATDALRNIVEASNPNSKMGLKAINESARQLIAIVKMEMANQKAIEQHKLNNDSNTVLKNDAEFARYADPKIWELEGMNSQERAAYIGSLSPKAAQELLDKKEKLKLLGAF